MAELSETELLDLERRDKQATLAPWTYSADPGDVHEPVKASNRKGIWSPFGELRRVGDGAFIATVRNVLPRLLSGIRAARAEAEHLREQLKAKALELAEVRSELERLRGQKG